MTGPTLAQKVVLLAGALEAVPHAFGGALALAYWAEPRATIDIDLNVFVPAEERDEVLAPLGDLGVTVTDAGDVLARDGQVRVWWDRTPVDLFFAYDPFHAAARAGSVVVPFADTTITVLSATHLTVCKVVFDRPRDWVDIEAMLAMGTVIDTAEVLRWVGRIAGDADPRYDRVAELLTRTG